MRHPLLLLLLLLLPALLAPALVRADVARPIILAVGESTTAGFGVAAGESYPAQLQTLLDAAGHEYQVVNHGRSGSTSAMALAGLDRGLRLRPAIVLVSLGGNDRSNRVPPERTRENLRKLLQLYRRAGARVFLMDHDAADGTVSLHAGLAEEEGVELLPPLRAPLGTDASLFLADGRHPNAEGYARVAARLLELLTPHLQP